MPTSQDLNAALTTYGVSPSSFSFSFASLMAYIIFGIVGMYAFNYGRREKSYQPCVIGTVLLIYPYFVHSTILLYIIGIGVSSLLYFWRD
ncbi:MAG: hypothetical protein WCH62_02725 [Candidatus Omnitrophota bacterium]